MTPLLNKLETNHVREYLAQAHLSPDLQTDLLDHLCCEIETRLAEGRPFEEAFAITTAEWPVERLSKIQKDLHFTLKTKPMLIKFSAAAAVLAGILFLSPFSLPEPAATPPITAEVSKEALLWVVPPTFEPPTASPIAGLDMRKHLSSGFGMRMHPILKKRQLHRGIDLKAKTGTPVLATADGVVIFAGMDGLYGIAVRIQHANGYVTAYTHLSSHQVKVGQDVELGQTIAAVGSTGASTAPHLHYEILKNDKPVDPLALLD